MSVVARDRSKPSLMLRRVTRHSWGAEPRRVVVVTIVESEGQRVASVWDAEGASAVELERVAGSEVLRQRGPVTIVHPDGSRWVLGGVGCSCNVPPALKGFNPLRAG